ncbi:MAG: PHP domain-containing protein [Bacillota bacterium]
MPRLYQAWADFHTHTVHSHGSGTIEGNVRAAVTKGLLAVGITDHGPALWRHGVDLAFWSRIEEEVQAAREKYPGIRVLLGLEANVVSSYGHLDVPDWVLERLDILLVGFHLMIWPDSRDKLKLVVPNLAYSWLPREARAALRKSNTQALVRAVMKHDVDIVVHPGLHVDIDTEELAYACKERHTALEINASHEVPELEFVRSAAKTGVRFVVSSDAHSPAKVGDLSQALLLVRAAGLSPERVVNLYNDAFRATFGRT